MNGAHNKTRVRLSQINAPEFFVKFYVYSIRARSCSFVIGPK